ncbi:cytochrome P450 CYP72A219-like [Coffea arabica]|uniref:Cytochrome P450 CYP72A219-like n=1 Tax=Coffea arabica TaxID=13443 RepID=A0ABM4UGA7_COFAR
MKSSTLETQSKEINLHDDISSYAVPFDHHIIQKYGKKSFVWIGPIPRLNIMDPDMIRDILINYNTFHKPKGNFLLKLLVDGLAFEEGERWAKLRKILNPAFNLHKLKNMLPAIYLSCSEIVSKWETLISPTGSSEINVLPYLAYLSADVISRTAFGSSYEEGRRIFQLQKEQIQLILENSQSSYIPGWRFLPTKSNKKMKEINREIRAIVKDLISKREKKLKEGEMKTEDLLGMLLESNIKEIQESGNKKDAGITIDQVIEECKLFYFAGQETTSNLLAWTMVMLATHRNWQERAREEVFQVFGNNKPDFEGLNHLKVVTMILNEVLRLYPPVSMVSRKTYETTKLGDVTLPPGVEHLLHITFVHHDTELWGDDAKEFNPERFSQGVAKAVQKPNSYFPFGLGPRICIGQNLATIEAKMAVAMILQRFLFELSPSYLHGPQIRLTLQPRFGAHMILHKI